MLEYLKFSDDSKYPQEDFTDDDEIDILDFHFGIDNLEDFFDDKVDRSGKEIINTPLGSFDRQ